MLQLKQISFRVQDEPDNADREILEGIDLHVEKGSLIVITGPNGGGKSTLAKIIMGIKEPTTGTILFEGEDITKLDITQRATKGIGFAFQQPVRFKGLTVQDLLRLSSGQTFSTEAACEYLSAVGLCADEYINREINGNLSGGELKRIEIAMLIARKPKLLIFDEPEAGIDLWSFHNLIRVFEKMRSDENHAIVIISHQERILEIADQIVVIENGTIAKTGDKDTILPGLLADSDHCRFFREEA